jgi:hypothetical protein
MFVNILTNDKTGRQKMFRKDRILSILYNGKTGITVRYIADNGKHRSNGYSYSSQEEARKQYELIMAQLTNLKDLT